MSRTSGTSLEEAKRALGTTGSVISALTTMSALGYLLKCNEKNDIYVGKKFLKKYLMGAPKTEAALKTKVARRRVDAEEIIVEQTKNKKSVK